MMLPGYAATALFVTTTGIAVILGFLFLVLTALTRLRSTLSAPHMCAAA